MRHIILTRMGIGIARASFYDAHIEMIRHGLLQSLAAQTSQNFEWVIFVDVRIPAEQERRLSELLAPYPNFSFYKLDSIEKGKVVPSYHMLPKKAGYAGPLVLSRLDDDDVVHKDTIRGMHAFIEQTLKTQSHFSVIFQEGMYLHIEGDAYWRRSNPHIALMLSTVSTTDEPLDIFNFRHTKIVQYMNDMGYQHYALPSDEAYWIYAQRPGSDSDHPQEAPNNYVKVDESVFKAIEDCGLSADWLEHARRLPKDFADKVPQIISGDKKLNRMTVKRNIFNEVMRQKRAGNADTDFYHSLVTAYYAM